jgi:hypothetical protein
LLTPVRFAGLPWLGVGFRRVGCLERAIGVRGLWGMVEAVILEGNGVRVDLGEVVRRHSLLTPKNCDLLASKDCGVGHVRPSERATNPPLHQGQGSSTFRLAHIQLRPSISDRGCYEWEAVRSNTFTRSRSPLSLAFFFGVAVVRVQDCSMRCPEELLQDRRSLLTQTCTGKPF